MTSLQTLITIAAVVLATVLTRFLPYIIFPEGRKIPGTVHYLGTYLAPAVFGLLVIYCLRTVDLFLPPFGAPSLIVSLVTVLLFLWKRGMVFPMAGGTITYMLLVNLVFN